MQRLKVMDPAPLCVFEINLIALAGQGESHRTLIREVEALGYQTWLMNENQLVRYRPDYPLMLTVTDFVATRTASRLREVAATAGRWRIVNDFSDKEVLRQIVEESHYISERAHRIGLERALAALDAPALLAHPRVVRIQAEITALNNGAAPSPLSFLSTQRLRNLVRKAWHRALKVTHLERVEGK
jgi:hypothetical protein